jgi:V8-like Glu-specific endopeptidase
LPVAQQLTEVDAQVLLDASSHMEARRTVASVRTVERAIATSETSSVDLTATLPRGAEGLPATVPAASAISPLTAQALSPGQFGDYAVLDLGFGRTPAAGKKTAAVVVERPKAAGLDERTRVPGKTVTPWYLIGQLIVTWKDGTQSVCTGTLVSANVVLTAGQCAHNRDKGGFATKVTFAPGQSQTGGSGGALDQPYGIRHADYVETNSRWTQISGGQSIQITDARSDYAAFYFAQPWNVTDTFMPIVYGDTSNGTFNTAGYPTEAGGQGFNQDMWLSSGGETVRSANLLRSMQVRDGRRVVRRRK